MKVNELVDLYVKGRDKLAELKAEFDAKKAPIEAKMEKIEQALLATMNNAGIDSVKTDAGTAYKSTRTSVSAADREIFMDFIKNNEAWALLEVRPAKKAVEDYMAANDELPPGVNIRSETVVNFRRSA